MSYWHTRQSSRWHLYLLSRTRTALGCLIPFNIMKKIPTGHLGKVSFGLGCYSVIPLHHADLLKLAYGWWIPGVGSFYGETDELKAEAFRALTYAADPGGWHDHLGLCRCVRRLVVWNVVLIYKSRRLWNQYAQVLATVLLVWANASACRHTSQWPLNILFAFENGLHWSVPSTL